MPVQINEVIIRAIIAGNENSAHRENADSMPETISSISKEELLELIDEVITDKKER